jgi:hypothetical protein
VRVDGGGRGIAVRLALALGAVLVVALAWEAVLRVAAPQTIPLEGLMREDPAVGLRHVPGFRGRLRGGPYDVAIAISAQGYRDREYPPRGAAFRVLGLGDSFAFGYGVEEPEGYLARLEALAADRGVEVINAGHAAMGPDNEALLLEADGPRLRPDLVLLGVFVGNDVWNVLTGPHRAVVVDGVLRSRPGVLERWYRPVQGAVLGPPLPGVPASDAFGPRPRWLRRTHLYRFLSRRYAALAAGGRGAPTRPLTAVDDPAVLLRDPPPELDEGFEQACSWIGRMAAWCGAHRATLAVLLIPSAEQVEPERWAEARRRFALRDEGFDLERPQRLLGECARRHGAPVIDVLPALRAAAARGGERMYFPGDPHWTPAAHAVAAHEVLARLRVQGRLP